MNSFEKYLNEIGEIGFVTQVLDTIIYADGIPTAKLGEIVIFESQEAGQVISLFKDSVEIVMLSNSRVKVGTRLTRTGSGLKLPVGEELLGKIINPLGQALYGTPEAPNGTKSKNSGLVTVDHEPSGITNRKTIKKVLDTDVSIVDLMVPLGKGQRQLIVGDRQTGKTNFLLQAINTQANQGDICIYACIGKRKIDIKRAEEFFIKHNIMNKIILIASTSTDSAGLICLTPLSAMGIAEYFRDLGKDVVVVLDDMLTHAKYYREISLTGRKFPGRNSYPGDIFYLHAKIMERAGNFATEKGESSITCLPVSDTSEGDLSGFIQTNLISMTDGHLFFDKDMFYRGQRPAVNPFLSISRVGRQTQSRLKKSINRELISFLTLYEKVRTFVHFGSELSQTTRVTIEMGENIMKIFNQSPNEFIPSNVQVLIFTALWGHFIQGPDVEKIPEKREKLAQIYLKDSKFKYDLDAFLESCISLNDLISKLKTRKEFMDQLMKL